MMAHLRIGLLLLACALTVWGQADANKSQLFGAVFDAKGALVPGATVLIKNTATGFAREVKTNDAGQYRAVQLDPGAYEVVAQSSGFAPATLTGIQLSVGAGLNLDITLQLQATTQSIEVVASMLNVAVPAPTAMVVSEAIRDLPINGRRFHDFATLTPTVQVDPARGQLSFAGQRGINGNVMVDGADYNQPFFGGIRGGERSNNNFTIPQGAVQEFQAISSGYAAEYGRSTGGVLNVITKSGTNEIHGDAFYQNRNRELSAKYPIPLILPGTTTPTKVTPSENLQQYGGSAGGPVVRDRFFWFGAIERQNSDIPAQVYFPALNPITPTAATKEAFDHFRGLEEKFTRENSATALTAKADYMFSSGHRLSMRYNYSRSDEPNSVTTGGAIAPFTSLALSNEGTEKDRIHFGTLQYTHLFSPSVVNDTKFSQSYEVRPRIANANAVTMGAGNIGTYGTRSFLPTTQDDWRTQITNSTTVIRGKHTLKFGLDFNKLSTVQAFGFNQFGAFGFQNSADIAGILDIMSLGGTFPNRFDNFNVRYVRQVGNLIADFGAKQLAFFAQDSWRVSNKLSFDLGLRWEGQWNPKMDTSNATLVGRVNRLYPVGATLDVGKLDNSLDQIMPRAGFAWTPLNSSRRTIIRGYGGMFYAATPLLLYSGPSNNFRTPPGDVSIQLGPFAANSTQTVYTLFRQVGVDLNTSNLGSLPIIPLEKVQQAAAIAAGGTATDPLVGASLTTFAPGFRNPRSYQYGIGIESELARNWLAGVQFQQVNAVNLQRNRDYNLPLPTIRAADGRPVFARASRPVTQQGTYTVRESSARSQYRAMVVQTQYRSKKFTAGVFYTLSTNYSDDDNERNSGGSSAENIYNLKPEYNYSVLDARHMLTAHALYHLPWGFEVSGILRTRSGAPYDAIVGSDTNGDAANTDRPYSAAGVPFLRNAFRNRGVTLNNDLRILKSFNLKGERMKIQLSAEFFNLFNAANVIFAGQGNVYGAGINPTTGAAAPIDARFILLRNTAGDYNANTTTMAGNPRQIQFGARFYF